jgi:hypothetical protein
MVHNMVIVKEFRHTTIVWVYNGKKIQRSAGYNLICKRKYILMLLFASNKILQYYCLKPEWLYIIICCLPFFTIIK